MFKKFFDTVRLHHEIKVLTEAINTAKTNAEACLEMMEHPVKSQKQIKKLLTEITKI